MVRRILETLCNGLRLLLGGLMAALAVPVAMQVLSRYTGIIPTFLWTEELATFIFIWMVMIGSMVAVWDGTHFDVIIGRDAITPLGKLIQKSIVHLSILFFAVYFAWYGIEYARVGSIQHSMMLRANLFWIYVSVPLAGAVWALFSAYRLYETIAAYLAHKKAVS